MVCGGIAGLSNTSCQIKNCYNIGTLTKQGTGAKAGIVGYSSNITQENVSEYVINCYYELNGNSYKGFYDYTDVEGSITKVAVGGLKNNSSIIESLNQDEEEDVWYADAIGINNGYPVLKWMLCGDDSE